MCIVLLLLLLPRPVVKSLCLCVCLFFGALGAHNRIKSGAAQTKALFLSPITTKHSSKSSYSEEKRQHQYMPLNAKTGAERAVDRKEEEGEEAQEKVEMLHR